MKTVINRAVKILINSSDDSDLFDDEDSNEPIDVKAEVVRQEITENANKLDIGFSDNIGSDQGEPHEIKTNEANQPEAIDNSQPNGPSY